jgi:hypothetical protein
MNLRCARRTFFWTVIFAMMLFGAAGIPLTAQEGTESGVTGESEDEGRPYDDDYPYEDDSASEGEEGDENSDLPALPIWYDAPMTGYTRGDKTFNINLGVLLPLFFTSASGKSLDNNINLGGTGSLGYNYFLNSHVFVGGILQGSFSQTVGKNFLYLIPIGFTAGYQFILSRFEFPLSVTVGGMTEQYLTFNGYWLFLKPQASGFFRFNSDWSFGLNVAWWIVPQWTNTPEKDATGNFLEITLAARYHF